MTRAMMRREESRTKIVSLSFGFIPPFEDRTHEKYNIIVCTNPSRPARVEKTRRQRQTDASSSAGARYERDVSSFNLTHHDRAHHHHNLSSILTYLGGGGDGGLRLLVKLFDLLFSELFFSELRTASVVFISKVTEDGRSSLDARGVDSASSSPVIDDSVLFPLPLLLLSPLRFPLLSLFPFLLFSLFSSSSPLLMILRDSETIMGKSSALFTVLTSVVVVEVAVAGSGPFALVDIKLNLLIPLFFLLLLPLLPLLPLLLLLLLLLLLPLLLSLSTLSQLFLEASSEDKRMSVASTSPSLPSLGSWVSAGSWAAGLHGFCRLRRALRQILLVLGRIFPWERRYKYDFLYV